MSEGRPRLVSEQGALFVPPRLAPHVAELWLKDLRRQQLDKAGSRGSSVWRISALAPDVRELYEAMLHVQDAPRSVPGHSVMDNALGSKIEVAAEVEGPSSVVFRADALTSAEVAQILGVSTRQVTRLVQSGRLQPLPRSGHSYVFTREALDFYINEKEGA